MTCTQMAGLSDEKVGWDVILGFGNDRSYGHFAADFRAKIGGESEAEQVRIMTVDGKVEKNKGRHMGRRMLSRYITVQLAPVSLSNACSCSRRNGHTRHLQMEMVPMLPCRRGTVLYHSHPPPFLRPSHPASHIIVQPLPQQFPIEARHHQLRLNSCLILPAVSTLLVARILTISA